MSQLIPALAASAVIVLAAPFVGEILSTMQRTFPGQYLTVVAATVVAPALVVLAAAAFRIRERRLVRYGAMAAAVTLAVVYATVMETSATEQFHFTEYGVLTFLFYRVRRWRHDATAVVLPVCAAIVTGFADEWFQWFVPSRAGELRDVVLNTVGVGSGLLFAMALDPPVRVAMPADRGGRQALAAGIATLVLTGAVFIDTVHLGYEIHDAETGRFRSHFAKAALHEVAEQRANAWRRTPPPPVMPLVSQEDHYLSEAMFHVQERNEALSAGDAWAAWHENLILEKFYAPVLETASPDSRWPPEQRDATAAAVVERGMYVSAAYPYPIYAWSRGWFWTATAAVMVVVSLLARPGAPRASDVVEA